MSDTMEVIDYWLGDFKACVTGLPVEFTLFDTGIKVWLDDIEAGCVMFTFDDIAGWRAYAVSIVGSNRGIFELPPMAALARVINAGIDHKLGI